MNDISSKQSNLTSCHSETGPGSVVSICSSNDDLNGNVSINDNDNTTEREMFFSCFEQYSGEYISCERDSYIDTRNSEITFLANSGKSNESKLRTSSEETHHEEGNVEIIHSGKTQIEGSTATMTHHAKTVKEETAVAREIRLAQNRKAARDSRKRKKNMVTDLQRTVTHYARSNLALRQQNEILQNYLNHAILQIRSFYPMEYQHISTFPPPRPDQQQSYLNTSTLAQTGLVVPDSYAHNHVLIKEEGKESIPKHLRDPNSQTYFVAKNLLPISPKIQGYQLPVTPASVVNVTTSQAYHAPVSDQRKYTVPNPLAKLDQVFAKENEDSHATDINDFDVSILKDTSDSIVESEDVSSASSQSNVLSDSVGFLASMAPSIFKEILNEFRK